MIKENFKLFFKILFCSLVWFIVSLLICLLLANFTNFKSPDILFFEGIIIVIIGIFSAIGGSPIASSVQGFGQVNAQYIASANLDTLKNEKSKTSDIIKTTINIGFSTVSVVLGGLLTILTSFII